jgi:hypothetical protein
MFGLALIPTNLPLVSLGESIIEIDIPFRLMEGIVTSLDE